MQQQLLMAAQQAIRAKQFGRTLRACRQALNADPSCVPALHMMAIALNETNDYKASVTSFEKAIALSPQPAPLLCDLAQAHIGRQRYEEAERSLRAALEADPSFVFALGSLAELHQLTGEYTKAKEVIEPAVERHPDDVRIALAYGSIAPQIDRAAEAAAHLERTLEAPGLNDETRTVILFRLGELHDHLGNYDRAFPFFERANETAARRHDPEEHARSIDAMIETWSPEAFGAMPTSNQVSRQPVFVVGMPRSGTSLVEQILSCHPAVHAASELAEINRVARALRGPTRLPIPHLDRAERINRASLDKHAREYLVFLHNLAPKAERVTDKMPDNFLHLGLIAKMLPGAAIIHCLRDPADTCLSCYFKNFRGPYQWSYDQSWLASYYRDYERLVAHWRDTLGIPMLEVRYEDLIGDQEQITREIVAHAGLDWDGACLRPHESKRIVGTLSNEQVRKPVYTSSIGRHKNYATHLATLLRSLGRSG